jgi:hypothetical protein
MLIAATEYIFESDLFAGNGTKTINALLKKVCASQFFLHLLVRDRYFNELPADFFVP